MHKCLKNRQRKEDVLNHREKKIVTSRVGHVKDIAIRQAIPLELE